jgi:hypothetical protein
MPQHITSWIRLAVLPALLLCLGTAHSQTPVDPRFKEEYTRQKSIYHDKAQEFVEGYVTDRGLEDYASALASGFEHSLANLGPEDRWLDIGAGRGQAILDYYSRRYDSTHTVAGKPPGKKARAVAMSIEDRRTVFWDQTAARLEPNQLQYVYNKTLREYSLDELGQFQVITDVIGGFSYTANLSLFMEKTLGFLAVNGSFYTVLQDVRSEDGTNTPYYQGAPFLTQIRDASGSDVGVCSWLKNISCVQVTCEYKPGWKPPLEVYRIRKTCENVVVPALETLHFVAGTPPERQFKLASQPTSEARKEATR